VAPDQPGGDVLHCLPDWDALVEHIAQSASVVIEQGGEPDPLLLGPRPPDCADDPWLTRVAGCLMSALPDLPSCCRLVNAVLSRLASVPVTMARRQRPSPSRAGAAVCVAGTASSSAAAGSVKSPWIP
jgi:hypothetical protein